MLCQTYSSHKVYYNKMAAVKTIWGEKEKKKKKRHEKRQGLTKMSSFSTHTDSRHPLVGDMLLEA